MTRLNANADLARDMVQDAISQNMDRLIQAWDKEIDAAFEALRQKAAQMEVTKRLENDQARRRLSQEAADSALSSSVASYLEGLAVQAQANDASAVCVPTGFLAASTMICGPALAGLADLIDDIQGEVNEGSSDSPIVVARQSAAWALGEGLPPHGRDLSAILDHFGLDAAWSERFSALATRLDDAQLKNPGHGQLKGVVGHERINLLREHIKTLDAFGGPRLIGLVSNPAGLVGTNPGGPLPGVNTTSNSGVAPATLNRILDGLFSK